MQTSLARRVAPSEEWRASIAQRLAAVHALWQQGVSDLTNDQVNHLERAGVLPIAFTLMHLVVGEDRKYLVTMLAGGTSNATRELWTGQSTVGYIPGASSPSLLTARAVMGAPASALTPAPVPPEPAAR